jgi:hypothetical protein
MPELFDVLLSDVDEELLQNEISTKLGSSYLSETPHLESPHATFGDHNRVLQLFPLVVRFRGNPSYIVYFVYDSSSPFTFLSQEVCGIPKPFTCNH